MLAAISRSMSCVGSGTTIMATTATTSTVSARSARRATAKRAAPGRFTARTFGRDGSQLAPAIERAAKRDLIGELEIATVGHATGDARHTHTERLERLREIHGRGLAIHAERRGDHQLFDAF